MPNDQGYDEWWGINEGSNAAGYTSTPQSKPTELYDIIRWPGKIPGGKVSDESVADLGIYPTLAHLVGEEKRIPADRPIDGIDQSEFLLGENGCCGARNGMAEGQGKEGRAVR